MKVNFNLSTLTICKIKEYNIITDDDLPKFNIDLDVFYKKKIEGINDLKYLITFFEDLIHIIFKLEQLLYSREKHNSLTSALTRLHENIILDYDLTKNIKGIKEFILPYIYYTQLNTIFKDLDWYKGMFKIAKLKGLKIEGDQIHTSKRSLQDFFTNIAGVGTAIKNFKLNKALEYFIVDILPLNLRNALDKEYIII